jgi:hypothetical protein
MPSDPQIYCNCMERIRRRLNIIDDVLAGRINTNNNTDVMAEIIFIQFRKSLEELAFASLSANKDVYSALHEKFAVHWRANDMLNELAKVNPDFYPVAAEPPKETSHGLKHFDRLPGGFMTREEFAKLYKHSSGVLHTRNPYKEGDPTINIGYTVQEWAARFRSLIRWHFVTLVSGNVLLANVPDEGAVHAYPSAAIPTIGDVPDGR